MTILDHFSPFWIIEDQFGRSLFQKCAANFKILDKPLQGDSFKNYWTQTSLPYTHLNAFFILNSSVLMNIWILILFLSWKFKLILDLLSALNTCFERVTGKVMCCQIEN